MMLPLASQRIRLLEEFTRITTRFAGRFPKRAEHMETGRRGETAAYFYLRRQGYIIVARRWRNANLHGDLDLVAWEGPVLCFIEVKTRTSRSVATAESAVDEEKRRMLRRMGRQYLRSLAQPPEQVRFDILSLYMESGEEPQFELFRNAFGWF